MAPLNLRKDRKCRKKKRRAESTKWALFVTDKDIVESWCVPDTQEDVYIYCINALYIHDVG